MAGEAEEGLGRLTILAAVAEGGTKANSGVMVENVCVILSSPSQKSGSILVSQTIMQEHASFELQPNQRAHTFFS